MWVPEHTHIPASRRSPWPHPPILMGGDGATTFDRVVEFCDGWMRVLVGRPGETLRPRLELLRARWRDAGRDPKTLDVSVFAVRPRPPILDELAAVIR